MKSENPVGVLDSGVGGISVLRALTKLLPNEQFVYFGDSANAPYGTKSREEVLRLTFQTTEFLLKMNCKAIVIACNTATAAAAQQLREHYKTLPIIGVEPAIKPAALFMNHPRVLILATPMTLQLEKFKNLAENLSDKATFKTLPCPGLVELIETGKARAPQTEEYLRTLLKEELQDPPNAIVLGCTHFPFVGQTLRRIFGNSVRLFDGAEGTARQLRRKLSENCLLAPPENPGRVVFRNSLHSDEKIKLMENLFFYGF